MLQTISFPSQAGPVRRLAIIVSLIVLLSLMLPGAALADPPDPTGGEPCTQCHEEETEAWENSPHARVTDAETGQSEVTCQACHGSYTENHPQEGVMRLTVDSSVCEQCHSSTFAQWENSRHAQAGVQCIGCHKSHSQELRLTDETLCASCHRDRQNDFADSVHGNAGVTCIQCHLASTNSQEIALAGTGELKGPVSAPNHDFTSVSAETCLNCHGPDIHIEKPAVASAAWTTSARVLALADRVPGLRAELETAQQTNKSLQTMTLVCLGLGLGIGGMLGIIFMLTVGYINQRRANR